MRSEYFEGSVIESIQEPIDEEFYERPKDIESKMFEMETNLYKSLRASLESDRKKHFHPYTFKINENISDLVRSKLIMDC
jgi:hypothetical protein